MKSNRIRCFCSWSGGKDSALAGYNAQKDGKKIVCLANMLNSTGRRSHSHGLSPDLLKSQAQAMGIPIVFKSASWNTYERQFKNMISLIKKKDITGGVFGDIDLIIHRQWVKNICQQEGITPFLPLWNKKRLDLISDIIEKGFKAIVVGVNSKFLSREWLGRIIDRQFVKDISMLQNVDICGEKGEYHTFVYDGPCFKIPVKFIKGKIKSNNQYYFLELISQK